MFLFPHIVRDRRSLGWSNLLGVSKEPREAGVNNSLVIGAKVVTPVDEREAGLCYTPTGGVPLLSRHIHLCETQELGRTPPPHERNGR